MKNYILLMLLNLQWQVILPNSTYKESKEWNNIKEKAQEWKSLKQKFENDKNHLIHKFEKEFNYLVENDNLHFEQREFLDEIIFYYKWKCYMFTETYTTKHPATPIDMYRSIKFCLAKIAQAKTENLYSYIQQQNISKKAQEKPAEKAFKKVMATQKIKGSLSYIVNGTLEKDFLEFIDS